MDEQPDDVLWNELRRCTTGALYAKEHTTLVQFDNGATGTWAVPLPMRERFSAALLDEATTAAWFRHVCFFFFFCSSFLGGC
jgi:hypothetical protein